jgi:hypothetical protein
MLVRPDNRRVEQQGLQVGQANRLKQSFPNAALRPPIEALIHRIPLAVALGQIPPWGAGPGNPNDSVDKPTIVFAVSAWISFLAWQEVLDQNPLLVREFVTAHGSASLPVRKMKTRCQPFSNAKLPNRPR